MHISICKTNSDRRTLNKSVSIIKTTGCTINHPCTILNPKILVTRGDLDIASINYAYIDSFKRYYYIDNVNILTNDVIELELSVDVLQTYRASISNLQVLVTRQEYLNSSYITDTKLPIFSNRMISYHNVGTIPDNQGGMNIAITVSGGRS